MDLKTHDDMMKLREAVYTAHVAATRKLHAIDYEVDTWMDPVYDAMLAVVHEWIKGTDLRSVSRDRLVILERPSLGHVDYLSKFSLYVAEWVYGLDGLPR